MAIFEPRVLHEILTSMIDFVRVNSNITDFNRGSLIRTTLEAAALEDDEQYYQMVQLLKEFSYRTASKEGLIRRASDFDIYPLGATPASGNIIFMDDGLERTYLTSASIPAGTGLVNVENAGVFSAGTPFTLRLAEGLSTQEDVTVTNVDAVNNRLTISPATLNPHIGLGSTTFDEVLDEYYLDTARASYVSGAANIVVNSGQIVAAPSVGELSEVRYVTTEASVITNGDFKSNLTSVRAERQGKAGNVGPLRVIAFPVALPFSNALVLNPEATGGGLNAETDSEFSDRIAETIASLSRGTVLAIRNFLLQVQDPVTLKRVARLTVLEEFVRDPSLPGDGRFRAYVDDGSGAFSPEIDVFAFGNLNGPTIAGTGTFNIDVTEGSFAASGWIIIDPNGSPEIVEYSSITSAFPAVVTLVGTVKNVHLNNISVLQIEQLTASSEAVDRFYKTNNIAIVENTFRFFKRELLMGIPVLTELVLFVPGVTTVATSDFLLNEGTGQIEIFSSSLPLAGTELFVYYNRYAGLIERAQRTLDGDLNYSLIFPGVRSGGVKGLVVPASYIVIDIDLNLSILEGFARNETIERVNRVVRNHINSLEPGEDFIVNEMIERVMGVAGLYDLTVNDPSNNVTVGQAYVAIPGIVKIS